MIRKFFLLLGLFTAVSVMAAAELSSVLTAEVLKKASFELPQEFTPSRILLFPPDSLCVLPPGRSSKRLPAVR